MTDIEEGKIDTGSIGLDDSDKNSTQQLPHRNLNSNTLYERALKNATRSDRVGYASLKWKNVSFIVGGKKERTILNNVSGSVSPGRLCAIIGASGAGKTSLLNILAGRLQGASSATIKGEMYLNGERVNPKNIGGEIAYVMQHDALFATQTPREALEFSAALRLPKSVTKSQRMKMVDSLLEQLHLTKCADTPIGNELVKGISGGEKKRTAIGIELISRPKILYLDEPTSGLDTYVSSSPPHSFQSISLLIIILTKSCTSTGTLHFSSYRF